MCEEEPDPVNEHQNNDMLICDDSQSEKQRDGADQEGDMLNGGVALESHLQPCDSFRGHIMKESTQCILCHLLCTQRERQSSQLF